MNICRSIRTPATGLLSTMTKNRGFLYTSRVTRRREYGLEALNQKIMPNHNQHMKCFSSISPIKTESGKIQQHQFDTLLEETNELIRSMNVETHGAETLMQSRIDSLFEQWVQLSSIHGLNAAEVSISLLRALEQSAENHEKMRYLAPDAATYNHVLHAFASCHQGEPQHSLPAAEKASEILKGMISRCREKSKIGGNAVFPTIRSFNIVLNAWAKAKSPESGKKAEELFLDMENWFLTCKLESWAEAPPNGRTLCAIMDAWANSGAIGAASRVQSILQVAIERQKKVYMEKNNELYGYAMKPDVIMFNTAIHAWALLKESSRDKTYETRKAENLLRMMESLHESGALGPRDENDGDDAGLIANTRTYSILINAWSEWQCPKLKAMQRSEYKEGYGAEQAERLLREMISRYHSTGESAKPNAVTFTTCIKAWSRCVKHPDFLSRAQAIMDEMIELYRKTNDIDFKPNARTFNTLISTYSKDTNVRSAFKAENLLETMKEFCEPDIFSYNLVIDAFAKHGEMHKAIAILEKLEKSESLKPDIVTYNTTLQAMTKVKGCGPLAQTLLDRMITEGAVTPNKLSYTSVIHAWGSTSYYRENPAQRVVLLFEKMLEEYRAGNRNLKPDVVTFTATINAVANARGKNDDLENALDFALSVFDLMKNSPEFDDPNFLTYQSIMKACTNLQAGSSIRTQMLEDIFKGCIAAKSVSIKLLNLFKKSSPKFVHKKYNIHMDDARVPESWCQNVRATERPNVIKVND
jgi:pentatricopeptide repeat protein